MMLFLDIFYTHTHTHTHNHFKPKIISPTFKMLKKSWRYKSLTQYLIFQLSLSRSHVKNRCVLLQKKDRSKVKVPKLIFLKRAVHFRETRMCNGKSQLERLTFIRGTKWIEWVREKLFAIVNFEPDWRYFRRYCSIVARCAFNNGSCVSIFG